MRFLDRFEMSMQERMEKRLFCFGSDDGADAGDRTVGLSDEDLDNDLQQDIAMAAAMRGGAQTTGNYNFGSSFRDDGSLSDPDDESLARAVAATQAINAVDPLNNAETRAIQDRMANNQLVQSAVTDLARRQNALALSR